jgi:hypothetical protein
MTSEGLGEMFEGYSADTRAGQFPLVSMGGRAEGLACADPGARTPTGASGIIYLYYIFMHFLPVSGEYSGHYYPYIFIKYPTGINYKFCLKTH